MIGVDSSLPAVSGAPLTSRESTILALLALGLSARQIAVATRISPRTVTKHLEHVYAKLGVHDRLQAARAAERLGLAETAAAAE